MNNGINPTIKQDAAICHSANLSEEEEPSVRIDKPDKTPVPLNPIINKTNHQGTPRFLNGDRLRKA